MNTQQREGERERERETEEERKLREKLEAMEVKAMVDHRKEQIRRAREMER